MKISTSVLSVTDHIERTVSTLNQTTTDYLHLDVMDGKFVENNTIKQMDTVLMYNTKPLDIHLMVENVMPFIEKYKTRKPDYITFHVEIKEDILSIIHLIKSYGIKVGIACNPNTDVSTLLPYLPHVDLILVMSVEAGYGGQVFDVGTPEKIEALIRLRNEKKYHYAIEVDGGIDSDTVSKVKKADIVVSGSYIMNGNYEERITELRNDNV